ncbi:AsmA family protein [Aquisalimonas sp.]|uniref:DUF748 domain-containing protein n=1 Tax=Aquisalimonas sp. TaxID=1872621 RepID=UPI0025C04B88|nr:AsmA family protein [Aquisalimonas sp.]
MRLVLNLIVGLVILALVALGVGILFADTLLRMAVERGGSHATGTEVTLEEASIGLFEGQASLSALTVGNPEGFDADDFLDLDDTDVDIDLRSLIGDEVRISHIELDGLALNLEQRGANNNVQAIVENIQRLQPDEDPDVVDDEAPVEDGQAVLIERLTLSNVQVNADAEIAGERVGVNLQLDDIEVTDISTEAETGELIAQLSGVVIEAVLKAVVEQADGALPSQITEQLTDAVGRLTAAGAASFDYAGEGVARVIDVTGDGAEALLERIADRAPELIEEGSDRLRETIDDLGEDVGGALEDAVEGLRDRF